MGPFGAAPAAAPPVAPALELRSCCTKRPCWSSASTVEVGRAGAVLHGEKAQPVELKKIQLPLLKLMLRLAADRSER